ncbi:helix-turn-helix domain-containing protein [Kutzneria sp. 744]|uniref:helix-turn-helix domain-containing protein n=1 Tax=Kutzneria sp. (strain 744) TaxID=345341 RepID=UPI0003EED81C|nr:helix-turn-helix domain-containing protein [Kutzneria sp. 744]EWM14313.1 toxin-antitoxin system, antitoxin component, Xre family [Kutzneria sp. 744]
MARSWKEVKADKAAIDQANGRDVDAARATARNRVEAYVLGFRLGQLREQARVTQTELARRMGVSQPRVSQLEQGDLNQLTVDTVRRYAEALGGQLKIVVDFEDHDVTVSTSEVDCEHVSA